MTNRSIEVCCENCHSTTSVDLGLAGAAVRCPSCGRATLVPGDAATISVHEPKPESKAIAPPVIEATPREMAAHALPSAEAELPAQQSNSLAVASLICGLLSIGGVCCGGQILGIVAIVIGAMALPRGQSRVFAITGIILGALALLVGLAGIFFALGDPH